MSIDSVKRNSWIETTADNKDKLNRWLRSCHSIHYQNADRERTIFYMVQRNRLRAIKRGIFRDWKCVVLIRRNSNHWTIYRTFQIMKKRLYFRDHIIRQLERVYNRSLCVAFAKWVKITRYLRKVNDKLVLDNRRNQCARYLRRVGKMAKMMMMWLASILELRKVRLFYKWKELAQASSIIDRKHKKFVKRSCFKVWLRVSTRREAARRLKDIFIGCLGKWFTVWKRAPPLFRPSLCDAEPELPSPAKSIAPPELDTSQQIDPNLQCTCIRNILKGKHCKCSLATHMKLRLITCHKEAAEAVLLREESQRLNEVALNDLDVSIIDPLHPITSQPHSASKSRSAQLQQQQLSLSSSLLHSQQHIHSSTHNRVGDSPYHWTVSAAAPHSSMGVEANADAVLAHLNPSDLLSSSVGAAHALTSSGSLMTSTSSLHRPGIAYSPAQSINALIEGKKSALQLPSHHSPNTAMAKGIAAMPTASKRSGNSGVGVERASTKSLYATNGPSTIGLTKKNANAVARHMRAEQVKKYREIIPSGHLGMGARKAAQRNAGLMGR